MIGSERETKKERDIPGYFFRKHSNLHTMIAITLMGNSMKRGTKLKNRNMCIFTGN